MPSTPAKRFRRRIPPTRRSGSHTRPSWVPPDWIYSYDLVAAYYAVRQGGVLTEVGPGANSIDASGGNAFTPGAGSQYYLQLSNASALDLSIETLLDTVP